MLPLVGILPTIEVGLAPYRELFCRAAGFEHVSRYVTGLILSPNKTLQGIYGQQVWSEDAGGSRRAMHAAVFEAGWDSAGLMPCHRAVVAAEHRGRGREVIGLDWTFVHHGRGEQICGVKRAYDYVAHRMSNYQTGVTAAIANREIIDGVEVRVQEPNYEEAERAYLQMTPQTPYERLEQARQRLLELLHYHKNRLSYRKRTELAVAIVEQLEAAGHFPQADYAFDTGVLSVPLPRLIEGHAKHWVSELECSGHLLWKGQWCRVDDVAAQLRTNHPESFRALQVTGRNGETKAFWVFTKAGRLKKYGRKRLVIVHEQAELNDAPRFLLTDALHWESGRVIQMWSYRWSTEIFHELCKHVVGLAAAQVRKEEAVQRHFRLSCVAQSLLQRAACQGRKCERFTFALVLVQK